jgi:hypothetical protein
MKRIIALIVLLLGVFMTLCGYTLRYFSTKSLTVYRSLEYRNIAISKTILTSNNIKIFIGLIIFMFLLSSYMNYKNKINLNKGLACFTNIITASLSIFYLYDYSVFANSTYPVIILGLITIFVSSVVRLV